MELYGHGCAETRHTHAYNDVSLLAHRKSGSLNPQPSETYVFVLLLVFSLVPGLIKKNVQPQSLQKTTNPVKSISLQY